MDTNKMLFMVAYDYGMGGLWGLVRAHSEEDIRRLFPELVIVHERPDWMTDEQYSRMERLGTYDLDDLPGGILEAVIAERNHK
jgi:hypothetical protein